MHTNSTKYIDDVMTQNDQHLKLFLPQVLSFPKKGTLCCGAAIRRMLGRLRTTRNAKAAADAPLAAMEAKAAWMVAVGCIRWPDDCRRSFGKNRRYLLGSNLRRHRWKIICKFEMRNDKINFLKELIFFRLFYFGGKIKTGLFKAKIHRLGCCNISSQHQLESMSLIYSSRVACNAAENSNDSHDTGW